MMPILRGELLNEKVTLWTRSGTDVYGNPGWSLKSNVKVLWFDEQQLITDAQGREITSQAMIIHNHNSLAEGDFVYRGNSNSSTPIEGSWEIKKVRNSPSLRGGTGEKAAFL